MKRVTRRNALKGIAAAAGATVVGAASYQHFTSLARATDNWTISDASLFTSPDGNIKFMNVVADYAATWRGLDVPVAAVAWKDEIIIRPASDNISHVLYDATIGGKDHPNGLAHVTEFQNQNGSWGGSDETSTELTGDSQYEWMAGEVTAGIDWNFIVDPEFSGPNSVEDPYGEGDEGADPYMVVESPDDGVIVDSTIEWHKDLHLYKSDPDGTDDESNDATTQGGTDVVKPMQDANDGEIGVIESVATFTVSVENEPSSSNTSGTGSSSTG